MKVKSSFVGKGINFLTPNKEYEVISLNGILAEIIDDDGDIAYAIIENSRGANCSYLGNKATWEVVKEDDNGKNTIETYTQFEIEAGLFDKNQKFVKLDDIIEFVSKQRNDIACTGIEMANAIAYACGLGSNYVNQ